MPTEYGYSGTILWDALNDTTLRAMLIHSYRASPFKFGVPIWPWMLCFAFLDGLMSV